MLGEADLSREFLGRVDGGQAPEVVGRGGGIHPWPSPRTLGRQDAIGTVTWNNNVMEPPGAQGDGPAGLCLGRSQPDKQN